MTGCGPGNTDMSCPGFLDVCLWGWEAVDTLLSGLHSLFPRLG